MTSPAPSTRETSESTEFDFWVGEWDVSWPAEQMGGQAGETGHGTNRIEKIFGGVVVEENFAIPDQGFLGRSLSVFDAKAGLWRQTWVDTDGNYLVFTGTFDGVTMELRTEPEDRGDQVVVHRMVFSEITDDSLLWQWQGSRDGGETWNELWTIDYRRRS